MVDPGLSTLGAGALLESRAWAAGSRWSRADWGAGPVAAKVDRSRLLTAKGQAGCSPSASSRCPVTPVTVNAAGTLDRRPQELSSNPPAAVPVR
jgi:hypothetical protein